MEAPKICITKQNREGRVMYITEIKFDALDPWNMRFFGMVRAAVCKGNQKVFCKYARELCNSLGWYE